MEEIISVYRKLIDLLDDENAHIALCFQDKLLDSYREILEKEKDKLDKMLRTLY